MAPEEFTKFLVEHIATMAMTKAAPNIPSKTLIQAMRFLADDDEHGRVYIPHYWALYVHDGRGPFGTRADSGKVFLCWFRDPKNDPRLIGGSQVERWANVRHLSKEQWVFWLTENKLARAQKLPEPMIITQYVSKSTPATNFFRNDGGMAGLAQAVQSECTPLVQDYFKSDLEAEGLLNMKDSLTLSVG